MHKLVILIEAPEEKDQFEASWPKFLHLVEEMPGLRREAFCRVEGALLGHPYVQMHELFFDSLEAARQAMASPAGQMAGRLLQGLTRGRMTLFFAEHQEDDLENIRKYRSEHK